MTGLHRYITAFSNLHTATVKGYKALHRAVLLSSALPLLALVA